ncbi:GNAT family N-acetyltransferase [Duganella callida]|uniref:N-acetyltransferase n=1 Tax=Duganella callida TaxID=2561932 RepID=A0A4Y9SAC0_9BURK|nr:GNAT family N-acetyltransferase [Duganella callida]TFW16674.1 N-acetyltransferase [Duganella callida]
MNLDELQFRPLKAALPTKVLMNFRRDAGKEGVAPSAAPADVRGKVQWVTVEHKNKMIGVARMEMAPPEFCFVSELMILSTHRGQGIGHWFLKRIEQYCLDHKVFRLLLEAGEGTDNFYRSQAFVPDPLLPRLMRKEINPFQRRIFAAQYQ